MVASHKGASAGDQSFHIFFVVFAVIHVFLAAEGRSFVAGRMNRLECFSVKIPPEVSVNYLKSTFNCLKRPK